jgi:hypothetical protein
LNFVVLLILAILWAVVLVPPMLRARSDRSRRTIGTYTSRLGVLENVTRATSRRSAPVRPTVGTHARPRVQPYRVSALTAKRRRDMLSLLGMLALVSLAGAALSGTLATWALFGVCALALGAYAYAIVVCDRNAAERAMKVRYLPAARMRPSMILRRTAGS